MVTLKASSGVSFKSSNSSLNYKSELGLTESVLPILHYKCNDDSASTTVTDDIGNYNGTSQRNTNLISTTGKINNALTFNGVVGGQLVSHWKLNGDATDSKGDNDGTLSTPTVIDAMDSLDGWTGVNSAISLNTTNFQEGTGAINVYQTVEPGNSDITMKKDFSITDYTGKIINFYFYLTQDVIDNWGGGVCYLHSADGFFRYSFPSLVAGWNVFTYDCDNYQSTSGTPDLTQIYRFQFTIEGQHGGARQILEGELIFDYLVMDTPMKTKNKAGEDNKAYRFTDNGGAIIQTNGPYTEINSSQKFSISCWAKRNENYTSQTRRLVIQKNDYIELSVWASSYVVGLTIRENDGDYITVGSTTSMDLNTWYHIVGTYDGTNMRIYVNGVLEGSPTAVTEIREMNDGWNIGNWSSLTQEFPGDIDEVRIYSRDLDIDEVKSLYNGGTVTEDEEDYIDMNTNIDLDPNNHSLAFWYKSSNSKFQMLFQKSLLGTNGNIEFRPSDNVILVESYTNNLWDVGLSTGIDIDDGEWHHYCLVFGENVMLYTDGGLTDTETGSNDTADFRYRYIGGQGDNTWTYGQTPDGDFDDIRIYDRQISSAEAGELYHYGVGTEGNNIAKNRKIIKGRNASYTFKSDKNNIVLKGVKP